MLLYNTLLTFLYIHLPVSHWSFSCAVMKDINCIFGKLTEKHKVVYWLLSFDSILLTLHCYIPDYSNKQLKFFAILKLLWLCFHFQDFFLTDWFCVWVLFFTWGDEVCKMVIRHLKAFITKFPWDACKKLTCCLLSVCHASWVDTYPVSTQWPVCLLDTASHQSHVGVWADLSPAFSILET